MPKIIELTDTDVIIKNDNQITAIKIDEENPAYKQIKEETNSFSENMQQKNQTEILEETQADLIYQLMMGGVI